MDLNHLNECDECRAVFTSEYCPVCDVSVEITKIIAILKQHTKDIGFLAETFSNFLKGDQCK